MKKLTLNNPSFQYLLKSFEEWLTTLGYNKQSIYNHPIKIKELLHYLEANNIQQITELDNPVIQKYYTQLKYRNNQTQYGSLALNTLNKHINAIKLFIHYLNKAGRAEITINLKQETGIETNINPLTKQEIQQLYQATENYEPRRTIDEALGARDRAMLSLYYGCGLRRTEGVHINIDDINFDTHSIKVRKGKNYKPRLVPMHESVAKHLKEYIYDERPKLIKDPSPALLLSQQGKRIYAHTLYLRVKLLQERAGIEKRTDLHLLRHSIATHLLQEGMSLENVSRFLGHDSLESTQIYTHIAGLEDHSQPYHNIPKRHYYKPHADEL